MKSHDAGAGTAQRQPAAALREQAPGRTTAGEGATALNALQPYIDRSPRIRVQRRAIDAAFGSAIQRQADGLEDDEPLQARLGAAQAESVEARNNVVQRVNIQVGFDGSATQSMFAGPADDLTTTGLGNCIAIVAYHSAAPSLGAVMRHYDTVNAFAGMENDPVSGGQALTFDAAAIGAISAATAVLLVNQVPAAAGNTGLAVAIGGVWRDVDPGTTRWQSRFNLINALIAATGVEPHLAAATVNFDVATSTWT